MRRLILVAALCMTLGSCKGLGEWVGSPADPANPEGPTQGQELVEEVGGVLSAIPGAGPWILLVGAAASLLLAKKKKPPA